MALSLALLRGLYIIEIPMTLTSSYNPLGTHRTFWASALYPLPSLRATPASSKALTFHLAASGLSEQFSRKLDSLMDGK